MNPSDPSNEPESDSAPSDPDAELEEVFAEPVLKGQEGLESAQVIAASFLILVVGALAFIGLAAAPLYFPDTELFTRDGVLGEIRGSAEDSGIGQLGLVVAASVRLNAWLAPDSASVFYFGNVLIHLLNAVLVFLICRLLLDSFPNEGVPLLAGLFFAVHPVVTLSVNSVVNRSVLLATFFVLLAVWLYLRATQNQEIRYAAFAGSLASFLLAWACHALAWLLPFAILLVDLARRGEPARSVRVRLQTPYWGLLGIMVAARWAARGGVSGSSQDSMADSPLFAYIIKIVYPVGLNPYQATTQGSPLLSWLSYAVLFGIGLAVFVKYRTVGTGLIWFATVLFAQRVLLPGASLGGAGVYLPLAGLVWVVPGIIQAVPTGYPRAALGTVATGLVLALAILTYQRNQVWANPIQFWAEAVNACPDCYRPLAELGAAQLGSGQRQMQIDTEGGGTALSNAARTQLESAERTLSVATQFEDADAVTYTRLAETQLVLGRVAAAESGLKAALKKEPTNPEATLLLANVYAARVGSDGSETYLPLALDYYRRAAELGALDAQSRVRFADLLLRVGAAPDAARVLSPMIQQTDPPEPVIALLQRIAPVLERLNSNQEALAARLAENPQDPRIVYLRAEQLYLQRRFLHSAYLSQYLLREEGWQLDPWLLLGLNQAKLGGFEVFLTQWSLQSDQGAASPWRRMASSLAANQEWDAALIALAHGAGDDPQLGEPYVELARIALTARDNARAIDIVLQAAESAPESADTWLQLCDVAAEAGRPELATQMLIEAEKRGASREELAERRETLGLEETEAGVPTRTVIR